MEFLHSEVMNVYISSNQEVFAMLLEKKTLLMSKLVEVIF